MQAASITVGTSAVAVPITITPSRGMRLLARNGNSGNVYLGTAADVTTATGVLVAKGTPGSVAPLTIPPEHFNPSRPVYLIADAVSQVVDWSAQ